MFTLQILDCGQTFLFPLEGRSLVIGSHPSADLRLGEPGVEERHATLESHGEQVVLRAFPGAALSLNGKPVERAELTLGDRIEIGRAVLVVGRSVARPAKPEDVLGDTIVTRGNDRRRSERSKPGKRGGGRVLAVLAAAVAVVGLLFVVLQSQGSGDVVELANVDRHLRGGNVVAARAEIERLRRRWADDDQRLERVAQRAARVDAVEIAIAQRRESVLHDAEDRSYAQWIRLLEDEEKGGADEAARIAARVVRSSLTELLRSRPSRPGPLAPAPQPADPVARQAPAVPAPVATRDPVGNQAGSASSGNGDQDATTQSAADAAALASLLTEAGRLVQQGNFQQAIDALQAGLAQADDEHGQPLRAALLQARGAANTAMQALLDEAKERSAKGLHQDAANLLANAAHRFPSTAEFQALAAGADAARTAAEAQARAERVAAVKGGPAPVDEATRRYTLESLRALFDQIRTAEAAGDFAVTERLLRQGAGLVAERDPDYAGRLRQRADEAARIGELHDLCAAAIERGQRFDVQLRSGRMATLLGVDGSGFRAETIDGPQTVNVLDIAASGFRALIEQGKLGGRGALGAAVLLYRNGEGADAEQLLAKALRAEPKLKESVDAVIAHGRGDRPDPRGYTLGKDGFIAARAIDAQKSADKLLARLDGALRSKDAAVRDAFVTEVLAQGPDALDAVVLAFRREFQKQVDSLGKSTLKKQVERIAAQRELLDRARAAAKELIYDEARYFYPYKPPAVSSEKFAEYQRVQQEVDRLVAAVRSLWQDDRLRFKVPASLQQDLDRLDWTAKVLSDLGELDAAAMLEVEWARALLPGDTVALQNYCRTPAERQELEEWRAIEAYNAVAEKRVDAVEREQLRVTNEYRAMFRHRPLALNLKLHAAARGHAEEMSKLGYFAHMSPTPGRRTPYDRMKLAGYDFGSSENIALNDSAVSAHNAWCHSSGHHRNLLNPAHREFGIGATGRCWVQNFGQGREYAEDPAFVGGSGSPARGASK